jgi:hypothetical protein
LFETILVWYNQIVKKIFAKIENFLVSIAIVLGFFITFSGLTEPKKKDYLGRVILSFLGLILFFFCSLFLIAIIRKAVM